MLLDLPAGVTLPRLPFPSKPQPNAHTRLLYAIVAHIKSQGPKRSLLVLCIIEPFTKFTQVRTSFKFGLIAGVEVVERRNLKFRNPVGRVIGRDAEFFRRLVQILPIAFEITLTIIPAVW